MDYLLVSHRSAFRYWAKSQLLRHPDGCRYELSPWDTVGIARDIDLEKSGISVVADRAGRIDVLVERSARRQNAPNRIVHSWEGPLPIGSLCLIGDGILVVSPEMLFLQMATVLSLPEIIICGNVLCSAYLSNAQQSLNADTRSPTTLTTKERIDSFLTYAGGRRGVRKARRALRWVNEGAASVREAELASRLFTPRVYGGKGIIEAQLNYRIELDEIARNMAGRSYCVADFAWPLQHLVLEYDSNAFHTNAEAMQNDARRRNALLHMNYEVLTCTNDIFSSMKSMEALTAQLESRLYPHGRRPFDAPVSSQVALNRASRMITRGFV